MHKFIYILFISLSFFPGVQAQEKVVYDTAVSSPEGMDEHYAGKELQQPVDTMLTLNQLAVAADSVEKWKNLKSFEYAKWLDSLLKAKQDKEKLKFSSSRSRSSKSTSTTPSTYTEPEPSWLDNVFSSPLTRIIFWILAGLFIFFILYKLFLANTIFRKKTMTAPVAEVEEDVLTGESDFDTLINQSLKSDNYRLAVRYQYLKVLHKLADKHFIEMAADKTNYQYVREVAGRGGRAAHQDFQNEFASLTLSYEYVWYGEFAVDETIYRKIATGFTQFNQKL